MLKEYIYLCNGGSQDIDNFLSMSYEIGVEKLFILRNAHKMRLQQKATEDFYLALAIGQIFSSDKKSVSIMDLFPYAFAKEDIKEIELEQQRQKLMKYMLGNGGR